MKKPIYNEEQRFLIRELESTSGRMLILHLQEMKFVRNILKKIKQRFCKHPAEKLNKIADSHPADAYTEYRCRCCFKKIFWGWYDPR